MVPGFRLSDPQWGIFLGREMLRRLPGHFWSDPQECPLCGKESPGSIARGESTSPCLVTIYTCHLFGGPPHPPLLKRIASIGSSKTSKCRFQHYRCPDLRPRGASQERDRDWSASKRGAAPRGLVGRPLATPAHPTARRSPRRR